MNPWMYSRISEFLDSLFREEFDPSTTLRRSSGQGSGHSDQTKYDPEVLQLVKKHLVQGALYPRVGVRLAEELGQLAKARAAKGDQ
jgi:hypothetical protein